MSRGKLLQDQPAPPGCIDLDTPLAKQFGFTSDKFEGYLWQEKDIVTISFIESLQPNQGNLKKLFDAIEAKCFHIIVPTPLGRMIDICLNRGFKPCIINMNGMGTNCLISAALFERAKLAYRNKNEGRKSIFEKTSKQTE